MSKLASPSSSRRWPGSASRSLTSFDVATARADATAARVQAAGADRDVSEVRAELRAHTQALNALREAQLEQGREMREQGREMRDGFATVAVDMAQITALLTVAAWGQPTRRSCAARWCCLGRRRNARSST